MTDNVSIEKTVKQRRTTDEEWITAFQQSSSRQEVATKLGLGISAIIQREKKMRDAGVPLKDMVGTRKKGIDVEAAKKLIAELAQNNE